MGCEHCLVIPGVLSPKQVWEKLPLQRGFPGNDGRGGMADIVAMAVPLSLRTRERSREINKPDE